MSEAAILIEPLPRSGRGAHPRGHFVALSAAALLAGSALGGCASQPKPTAQLVRASTLVSEAEKSQAPRYAPTDLQRARDELSDAQTAESEHKYPTALRLAQRASADANLASARATSGAARQSADQVRTSLETLRQQLQQSATPAGDTGTGASGPGQDQP